MPTPSSEEEVRPSHNTCPPDDDRTSTWRSRATGSEELASSVGDVVMANDEITTQQRPESREQSGPAEENTSVNQRHSGKRTDIDEESPAAESLSPASTAEKQTAKEQTLTLADSYYGGSSGMGYEYPNVRLIPTSLSSFLRAGSQYRGSQQSERQVYEVQVDIKHVDMRESFLCGYLRIQGLTEDHPTLTTYFEGEIIGSKYSFLTQHEDWGSTDKVDLQHWAKFQAFRPFAKQARKANMTIPHLEQRENIFMRWKEHFLVPDHRVRTISGASFEGFYYICFNQVAGTVSGIYFHAKSEKFQQLELKHVPDRGCFGSMEFR